MVVDGLPGLDAKNLAAHAKSAEEHTVALALGPKRSTAPKSNSTPVQSLEFLLAVETGFMRSPKDPCISCMMMATFLCNVICVCQSNDSVVQSEVKTP